ncbi:LysR family transcriptional regulator [Sinirhodobacter sp. HNIBRBA609]|nr:LysR family transcriptional regulator [Sinirhodobacter sp. HNIBRBA609]
MDLLEGIRAFVATAQTGSFTAAAERLGVSNRLTSKYVAELELRLGVRLLQRTTRKVGLTPAGEDLLARAPVLLDELDDLVAGLGEDGRGLSGVLRVSAPVTFGEVFVQDMLRRFAEPHPDLTIDLRLSDRFVDLATEGIDLAFRIGVPRVSALRARKLGEVCSRIVASPDYLARNGAPEHPADLTSHACILDTNRAAASRWELLDAGQVVPVEVKGRFLVNSARAARDLALAGCGIAFCPDFVLADDLAQGRLVALLPGYESPRRPLNAIYLDGPVLPRKVRALIDFAVRELG